MMSSKQYDAPPTWAEPAQDDKPAWAEPAVKPAAKEPSKAKDEPVKRAGYGTQSAKDADPLRVNT